MAHSAASNRYRQNTPGKSPEFGLVCTPTDHESHDHSHDAMPSSAEGLTNPDHQISDENEHYPK
jgi:hypothetical protein